MLNELNLTPTESIILIIVCLVILTLSWLYEKPSNEADSISGTKPTETPKDYVKERYGAYIWLSNKHYN